MRKMDKKIDKRLRNLLTEVCDFALQHCEGYLWITHNVNYNRFPESLMITCMFSDELSALEAKQQGKLLELIEQKLMLIPVEFKNKHKQVLFMAEMKN